MTYEVERMEDGKFLVKMPQRHYVLNLVELTKLEDQITIAINQESDK